jgi:hypothetical protein
VNRSSTPLSLSRRSASPAEYPPPPPSPTDTATSYESQVILQETHPSSSDLDRNGLEEASLGPIRADDLFSQGSSVANLSLSRSFDGLLCSSSQDTISSAHVEPPLSQVSPDGSRCSTSLNDGSSPHILSPVVPSSQATQEDDISTTFALEEFSSYFSIAEREAGYSTGGLPILKANETESDFDVRKNQWAAGSELMLGVYDSLVEL